jgi:hypothetical protein
MGHSKKYSNIGGYVLNSFQYKEILDGRTIRLTLKSTSCGHVLEHFPNL